jgi:hypothetical protein
MKTTIDIADNILERSRQLAKKKKTTLRDLVEEGLLLVIDQNSKAANVEIRPVTVKGNGLSEAFRNASWEQIRQAAYQGHGA